MIHRRTLVLFSLAALSMACVKQPTVTIDHADVKNVTLQGIALDVYLKIHNANVYDFQIRRVHADVTIANQIALPPVDMAPAVWVPSNGDTVLPVATEVPWTVVPVIVEQTLTADKVTFHFKGTADVTATRALSIQEDHYPIDQDGELPRSLFLQGSPDGIKIQLGGDSARLDALWRTRSRPLPGFAVTAARLGI